MGNINKTPEKPARRKEMFRIGIEVAEQHFGKAERIPRSGKSSVRLATKGNERNKITIRTTQDNWFGFQRDGKGWNTLTGMDWVVLVAVDDPKDPKLARVHLVPGDEVRDRFDRAYAARIAAEHSIPDGQPVWISVYEEDKSEPVNLVGAGVGLDYPAVAAVPLQPGTTQEPVRKQFEQSALDPAPSLGKIIEDAKRGLALSLGVDISRIKIIVEM